MRANLRGVSAVSKEVVWASGTNGTVVMSNDGGVNFYHRPVPGGEALDFRDIEARSIDTVYLMSSGPGDASRIYKTQDSGGSWRLQLTNPDKDGFFDALAFWDDSRGLVLGDPVNGRFSIRITEDGGETWRAVETEAMPAARAEEAAFAASGTCLSVAPGGLAWFVTGGAGGGRVFHSRNWGKTWTVEETSVPHPVASSGLFSIAATAGGWIAVGGDYRQEVNGAGNLALSNLQVKAAPPIFLSAVVWRSAKEAIAVGPRGTFRSTDSGQTWELASEEGFHTLSTTVNGALFAAGARGRIARWD
ncbi:MAG: hypothetical protein JST93_03650 [Acidobacteria bacterium]|nr:hypothetical protein [Acidobacteriota bacterium]